jgi:rRNA maturation RNase YbeY
VPVTFHTEKTDFKLKQKLLHKKWVIQWIESQDAFCGKIAYIYTSNKQIRLINKEYLNHNYFTDVITFDYTKGNTISGDIFISIDQVRINAINYGTEENEELRRVMIHGVIHLLGYNDENDEERLVMQKMENEALHLWLKMV